MGVFFQEFSIAAVEMVVGIEGVDEPILLHAVLLVCGELGAAVTGSRGGGEDFNNERRCKRNMCFAEASGLPGSEIGEVREKGFVGA